MLNHILATLNDYVLAFDEDENKYSFISNNIAALTGYTAAEFENDHGLWQRLIDPRDATGIKTPPPAAGSHHEYTYRIKTRDGETKWVTEKRSIFNNDKGAGITVCIVRDIQREDEAKYNQEESMAGYSILF